MTLSGLILFTDVALDTSHLLASRYVAQMRVVITHVFSLYWDRHNLDQAHDMACLCDLLRGTSTPSLVSEMIFEIRIHQLRKKGRYLIVTPIRGRLTDGNVIYDDCMTTNMPGNKQILLALLVEAPLTDGITLHPGYYYHPRISKFPTVARDRPPTLTMFQITYIERRDACRRAGRVGED